MKNFKLWLEEKEKERLEIARLGKSKREPVRVARIYTQKKKQKAK